MNVFAQVSTKPRLDADAVREAVRRAMARPMDSRRDAELVREVSRALNQREDVVAGHLAGERLRVAGQMLERVRLRALNEGASTTQPQRFSSLAGVQAIALAARDAVARAQAKQRDRLVARKDLAATFAAEQERALMARYEQSDEQLAQDFDEAMSKISAQRQSA